MFHCDVVDIKNISLDKAQKFIESHKCGASLFFIGTVRDHNNEKEVTGITYDSHDAMVKKSFEEIYNEAIKKLNLQHPVAFVEHAKGYVPLGGISIIIAVACKH
ncbi:MAG: molybdenum cofactor biosynthesis protein MoaE, partial [Pelagibacteraceae bacterium]